MNALLLTSRGKKTHLTADRKQTLCKQEITDKAYISKDTSITKFKCEKCLNIRRGMSMHLKDYRNHNAVVGSYLDYVWTTERFLDTDNLYKWHVVGMAEETENDVIYGTYSTHKLAYETCVHLANYND